VEGKAVRFSISVFYLGPDLAPGSISPSGVAVLVFSGGEATEELFSSEAKQRQKARTVELRQASARDEAATAAGTNVHDIKASLASYRS
jgi:hypothetical protein